MKVPIAAAPKRVIFGERMSSAAPKRQMIPSPRTRRETWTPMTSPWMVSLTELEILTVRRVAVTPIASPARPKSVTMMSGELVRTTRVSVKISEVSAEMMIALFGKCFEKRAGSIPFPIASARQRTLL